MVFTKSLKGRYNFKYLLKKGKYISKNNITIYYLKNNSNNNNYLGICVSKKHGNSVVRNRLKRWAKEAYKEVEKNIMRGYSIIILYKKGIEVDNINFELIKNELVECLKGQSVYIDEKNNL